MDNTEKTAGESESPIVGAAKVIGSAVGKVASLATGGTASTRKPLKQKENVYQAEYLGSGTFSISKPKRRKTKRRQAALKNRQRGASLFRPCEAFLRGLVRAMCCTFPQRGETTESGSLVAQQPSSCGAARLGESWMVRPFHPMASA